MILLHTASHLSPLKSFVILTVLWSTQPFVKGAPLSQLRYANGNLRKDSSWLWKGQDYTVSQEGHLPVPYNKDGGTTMSIWG